MPAQLTEEVLAAAQRGDGYAFAVIWRELSPKVAGYLTARGVADPDAVTSDVFLFDPSTFAASHPIWWGNGYFPAPTGNDAPNPVRLDGIDVYAAGEAYTVAGGALADNPGFPGATWRPFPRMTAPTSR